MSDLSSVRRTIQGHLIADGELIRRYSEEIPEDLESPPLFDRFAGGQEVDPAELYVALDGEGRAAVGDSDRGLEALETILRRLRNCFPNETEAS